jgi:hypothetical protein
MQQQTSFEHKVTRKVGFWHSAILQTITAFISGRRRMYTYYVNQPMQYYKKVGKKYLHSVPRCKSESMNKWVNASVKSEGI